MRHLKSKQISAALLVLLYLLMSILLAYFFIFPAVQRDLGVFLIGFLTFGYFRAISYQIKDILEKAG